MAPKEDLNTYPASASQLPIEAWSNYIGRMAMHYLAPMVEKEDLVQEGLIGLVMAHQDYDASRGEWFPYARQRIIGTVSLYSMSAREIVSLPSHISKVKKHLWNLGKLYEADPSFSPNLLHEWAVVERAQDCSKARALKDKIGNLARNARTTPQHLIEQVVLHQKSLAILRHDEDEPYEMTAHLSTYLETLKPLNRRIVELLLDGYNEKEIAEQLFAEGLTKRIFTRQSIHQRLDTIREKLNHLRQET